MSMSDYVYRIAYPHPRTLRHLILSSAPVVAASYQVHHLPSHSLIRIGVLPLVTQPSRRQPRTILITSVVSPRLSAGLSPIQVVQVRLLALPQGPKDAFLF